MFSLVERVADPIEQGLPLDGSLALPIRTFDMRASNRKDESGGLAQSGGPSGSLPFSSSWHRRSVHVQKEYTRKSLKSDTNSIDILYDFVYDTNMTMMNGSRQEDKMSHETAVALRHIRVGVVRASRTIGTHYNRPGNPGKTLCGGDFSALDWTGKDAKAASAEDFQRFNVCSECAVIWLA